MNDDQFTKLFTYVEKRFDDMDRKMDERFDGVNDQINRLAGTVDALIGHYKDSQIEQAAQDAKWERLLEWAREVSEKTGVPLKDL